MCHRPCLFLSDARLPPTGCGGAPQNVTRPLAALPRSPLRGLSPHCTVRPRADFVTDYFPGFRKSPQSFHHVTGSRAILNTFPDTPQSRANRKFRPRSHAEDAEASLTGSRFSFRPISAAPKRVPVPAPLANPKQPTCQPHTGRRGFFLFEHSSRPKSCPIVSPAYIFVLAWNRNVEYNKTVFSE